MRLKDRDRSRQLATTQRSKQKQQQSAARVKANSKKRPRATFAPPQKNYGPLAPPRRKSDQFEEIVRLPEAALERMFEDSPRDRMVIVIQEPTIFLQACMALLEFGDFIQDSSISETCRFPEMLHAIALRDEETE